MKKTVVFCLMIIFMGSLSAEKKIGLALSGGGARGLAHIGVLKVIDELNIPIDYIAGTSSGAVIGALYSIGYSAADIESFFLEMEWDEIFDEKINRRNEYIGNKRWKPFSDLYFDVGKNMLPQLPQAFLSGNNLINIFFTKTYNYSHIRDFNDLPIPFRCVSTNILSGEEKIFSDGVLHEALRATMSFPSVLQPFKIDDQLYIDGGVVSNLPTEIVKEMGADFIIGIKANSGLKTEDDLHDLIDVLDQTINLQITENVERSLALCDVLIEPDLQGHSILDFNRKAEIIALGEAAAREYFSQHPLKIDHSIFPKETELLPEKIKFDRIKVKGNIFLSNAKTRDFTGLSTNKEYTKQEIADAMQQAYNSKLFNFIYPVIEQVDDRYVLIIKLDEKKRQRYGMDFSYNDQKEINLGVTLDLDNVVQKNSKMLLNVQLGNKQEINLDYVKNFGKHLGVYFHLFPYLKEYNLYSYNDEHQKTNSVRSLEGGGTFGVGIFAARAFILEFYGYYYRSKLYQNIAEFTERNVRSTGFGIKFLHEELNDYIFPMQGMEIFAKYSEANKELYSDFNNRTFFTRLRLILPFTKSISAKYKFEYGSHFEKKENDFDPFYIGGLDSFMGMHYNEKVAPIYKLTTTTLRLELLKNLFCDLQVNILNLGNVDYWQPEKYLYKGAGIILGYRSLLGPIRMAAAVNDEFKAYYYFSFGFEFDQFEFSRR